MTRQEILDACKAGGRIVHRVWTKTAKRGRGVSMTRKESYELVRSGHPTVKLRVDTVARVKKCGIEVVEMHDADLLRDFVTAVRNNDTLAADAAIQRAAQAARGL